MRVPRPSRAGFTLVELVVSLVIASLLATGAVMAAGQSQEAYRDTQQRSSMEARLRRGLERARRELVDTGETVLVPDPSGDLGTGNLAFRRPLGLDDDEIEWGPAQRLCFQYEPGEADDGADNDGDGLVDEGELVLVRDEGEPGEQRVVLCKSVRERLEGELANLADDNGNGVQDEGGFNVHRVGDVLFLRLTVEEAHPVSGSIQRTLTTAVRLRNLELDP